MSFDRIAGPSRGKQTANKVPAQTSGSVVGSNPGAANQGIAKHKTTHTEKGGKQTRKNVKGRVKNID